MVKKQAMFFFLLLKDEPMKLMCLDDSVPCLPVHLVLLTRSLSLCPNPPLRCTMPKSLT
jgi:hypothetical protein